MRTLVYSLLLVLLCATHAAPFQGNLGREPEDPFHKEQVEKMERAQKKALNKDRQESLKKDTAQLYKLATELKDSVEKTDENVLSLQVVRKTEEIEKLARDIRKKMRDAY
jgi:hypothetical protein